MTGLLAHGAVLADGADPGRPAWVGAGTKRRLDPLSYMACQAVDAVLPAGGLPRSTAVVFATAYGALRSTEGFLDSMSAYGDRGASPSPFTTSVHNATQGALCQLLELHGPGLTVSQGNCSCLQALRLGRDLLRRDAVPAVLVVAGDAPTAWSRGVVAELCGHRRRVGGGAAAVLLVRDGGPHHLTTTAPAEAAGLLANGDDPRDEEHRLAERVLGAWWPTCLLAALPVGSARPWHLREVQSGRGEELFLLPGGGDGTAAEPG